MDPALTSDYFKTGEEAVFATVCRPPSSSKTSKRNMSHEAKSDIGSTKYRPTFISYKSDLEEGIEGKDSSNENRTRERTNFTLQRHQPLTVSQNDIEDSCSKWQGSTHKNGQNKTHFPSQ